MLTRRDTILGTLAAAAIPTAARARRASLGWFDRAIVIDGLGGIEDSYAAEGTVRYTDRGWSDTLATGVTVVRDTIMPVGDVVDPWADYQRNLAKKQAIFAANPERLVHVHSARDIVAAKRDHKFGVILGTQDTVMIGAELDRLAQLKEDGVLTVQLTYNNSSLTGDGALEPRNAGLTRLGKRMIERIEAERLLLDLSHGGARTMAEAAAHATRPLVISHTGARALHDHPRNTDDPTIRAVADKGGVVGVYLMPFLRADSHPQAGDAIAHIEHIANVAGEDHVGIGSDNGVLPIAVDAAGIEANRKWMEARIKAGLAAPGSGIGIFPMVADYNSVDRYRRLAADLATRGWSQVRLEKLFGTNFLRVYGEAWGA